MRSCDALIWPLHFLPNIIVAFTHPLAMLQETSHHLYGRIYLCKATSSYVEDGETCPIWTPSPCYNNLLSFINLCGGHGHILFHLPGGGGLLNLFCSPVSVKALCCGRLACWYVYLMCSDDYSSVRLFWECRTMWWWKFLCSLLWRSFLMCSSIWNRGVFDFSFPFQEGLVRKVHFENVCPATSVMLCKW